MRLLIFSFCLSVSLLGAEPNRAPDAKEFFRQAFAHLAKLEARSATQSAGAATPKLNTGDVEYLPVQSLIRAQSDISVDNVLSKLEEKELNKDFSWAQEGSQWTLTHDQGRSSCANTDPIFVVKGPMGYVVADGHHDLYLSLYLGAETIPVKVVNDFSLLTPLEFWKKLQNDGLSYLKESPETLAKRTPQLNGVMDNPNRYLASLIALKIKADLKDAKAHIEKMKGPALPAWIKLNDSIPFVEFLLAAVMHENGIVYQRSGEPMYPTPS